jgi:hypothetical protein
VARPHRGQPRAAFQQSPLNSSSAILSSLGIVEKTGQQVVHVPLYKSIQNGNTPMTTSRKLFAMIALQLLPSACSPSTASRRPTLVEVWRGGDDALTVRLADAIEDKFRRSPDFTLSSGRKPHTLVVTIPTNVDWKQVGDRTRVLYTINFSSDTVPNLGSSSGACWADTLAECAADVVKHAKAAARKIP